jgi:aminopeptidase N
VRRDNLTRDEALARAGLISDLTYEVTLDLSNPEAETYPCTTVVRFRCSERGAGAFLDYAGPSVLELEVNGEARPGAEAFDGTRIRLDGLSEENEVRIRSASSYSHSGVGLHRFRDPVDGLLYTYTDSEPFDAHKVYPCFDQPDLKGRFRFSVLAPLDWEVTSNMAPDGEPLDAAPDEAVGSPARRWVFQETPPMSAYITCVVAGPYHVVRDRHGDVGLGVWCRRSLAKHLDPDEILEVTKQGFDFFARAFDYPYPWSTYDQAFVPEFNSGAMENIGLVTFNEVYVFRSKVTEAARERRAETILHEMAHMWFGDLVTMRWWDDLWLNESFATFMAVHAQVNATRFTNGWVTFANSEKTWAYQQDQLPTTHPIVADVPDTDAVHTNFDGITYAKGASVLRQLVAWVGEDAFLAGIRAYFRRHEFGNTDLADFLTALEETSGRDLRAWSKEWLETAGLNTLRAVAEIGQDGRYSGFTVTQESPPGWPILRPHRVTVGLYDRTGEGLVRRRRVELDVVGAGTRVDDLVGEPAADVVLVNDEDLAYAKIRLDERSLGTVIHGLRDLRDPLARAIAWSSCWDMVRDAEMPTRDFVALVLANAGAEEDVGLLQRLLGQAASAIERYGDPANRTAALGELASTAEREARSAEAGSDHQLAWARAFIGAAESGPHITVARGLLDGTEELKGLAVDTDLRWHIVTSLASAGAADADLIDAELERDPTDAGHRHASAARAARPEAKAKSEAWEAIVRDTSLPTAKVSALIQGFQQPAQEALLEPYAAAYFDALGAYWDERDLEVALAFTRGMYPHGIVHQRTVELTDSFLDGREVPGAVRRLLVEGRDQVQRAMRARARDVAAGSASR